MNYKYKFRPIIFFLFVLIPVSLMFNGCIRQSVEEQLEELMELEELMTDEDPVSLEEEKKLSENLHKNISKSRKIRPPKRITPVDILPLPESAPLPPVAETPEEQPASDQPAAEQFDEKKQTFEKTENVEITKPKEITNKTKPIEEVSLSNPPSAVNAFARIERIFEQMNWGDFSFNIPKTIKIGDTSQAHLLLELQKPVEEIKNLIMATAKAESVYIKFNGRVEARLYGSGFDIQSVSKDVQTLEASELYVWRWKLTPKESGVYPVRIDLLALYEMDGALGSSIVKSFSKEVNVKQYFFKSMFSFLYDNIAWFFIILILVGIGFILKRRSSYGL